MTAEARRRAERGMTLVEALVAVVLTGMITAAIAGALMVTLGPDQQAADRLASAHDAQQVALYLPDDVQSATAVDLAASSSPPCSGTEPGTNALLLGWLQSVPASTAYSVSYRVETVDGERRLTRFACQGTAAADRVVVVRGLDADRPGDPAITATSVGRRVTLRFRTTDGVVATSSGLRRTPPTVCTITSRALSTSTVSATGGVLAEPVTMTVALAQANLCTGMTLRFTGPSTLAPVTFSGSGASRTATLPSSGWSFGTYVLSVTDASTGSTVLAEETLVVEPPPCVASLAMVPNPVALGSATTLVSNVTATVTTTGVCGTLQLAYTTPGDGTARTVAVAGGTATIPGSTGQWAAGTVTVEVRETATLRVVGSASLTVTPFVACAVTAVTPNPTSVTMSGSNLSQPVTVTVSTTGSCSALELRYNRSTGDPEQIRTLGSGPSYSVTIPAASGPWQAGVVQLRVHQVGNPTAFATTGTLTVIGPCAVSGVSPSPSPVTRGPNERLSSPVTVTVQTTGSCAGLRLRYTPTNANSTVTPSLQPAANGQWTLTLGNGGGDPKWNAGNHLLEVLPSAGSTPFAITGTLVVQ